MELKSGIAEKERMRMRSEIISEALQMSDTFLRMFANSVRLFSSTKIFCAKRLFLTFLLMQEIDMYTIWLKSFKSKCGQLSIKMLK